MVKPSIDPEKWFHLLGLMMLNAGEWEVVGLYKVR